MPHCFVLFFFFDKVCCVAQAGLELAISYRWSQTPGPPSPASQVLGLQAHTVPSFCTFFLVRVRMKSLPNMDESLLKRFAWFWNSGLQMAQIPDHVTVSWGKNMFVPWFWGNAASTLYRGEGFQRVWEQLPGWLTCAGRRRSVCWAFGEYAMVVPLPLLCTTL